MNPDGSGCHDCEPGSSSPGGRVTSCTDCEKDKWSGAKAGSCKDCEAKKTVEAGKGTSADSCDWSK